MQSIGARKVDGRRKDNSNTYIIDGDDTNWNRVSCYYYKENNLTYGQESFEIVMRKRSGYYLLIEQQDTRPFETDGKHILHYDEKLMKQLINEYSGFFELLENRLLLEKKDPDQSGTLEYEK